MEFSFWPMERTTRRYGLGTRIFATDPWTVVRRSIEKRCLAASLKAALALLEQSEDFYRAAESGVKAAKPLLLYYCFMNLAKAYILTVRHRQDVNAAKHGLAERLDDPPNNKELLNAYLLAHMSTPVNSPGAPTINIFDDVLHAMSNQGLAANATRFDLPRSVSENFTPIC